MHSKPYASSPWEVEAERRRELVGEDFGGNHRHELPEEETSSSVGMTGLASVLPRTHHGRSQSRCEGTISSRSTAIGAARPGA